MSYQYHKRSISNVTQEQFSTINANRSSNLKGRKSLTPNRIVSNDNNRANTPNRIGTGGITKTTDNLNEKFKYVTINNNRKSLVKSAIDVPVSTLRKITENLNRKQTTFKQTNSNNTGLPTNFLNRFKEERTKTQSGSNYVTKSVDFNIRLDSTPKKYNYSKSPIIQRIKNDNNIIKRDDEIKNNRTVSPMKNVNRKSFDLNMSNDRKIVTVKELPLDNKFVYGNNFREINTSSLLITVFSNYLAEVIKS